MTSSGGRPDTAAVVVFTLSTVIIGAQIGLWVTAWWYDRQSHAHGEAVTAAAYAVVFIGGPAGALAGLVASLLAARLPGARLTLPVAFATLAVAGLATAILLFQMVM
jgi:hypothetical protein